MRSMGALEPGFLVEQARNLLTGDTKKVLSCSPSAIASRLDQVGRNIECHWHSMGFPHAQRSEHVGGWLFGGRTRDSLYLNQTVTGPTYCQSAICVFYAWPGAEHLCERKQEWVLPRDGSPASKTWAGSTGKS
jgi:hypothetical protein